jgi:ATP-dependent Clp protease ATP-binding subunit ClpC
MEFTPRATQALENARQLARDLSHSNIGSQHIVLGLFQLGFGVHFCVLRGLGFTSDSLRQAIAARVPVDTVPQTGPTFDISATATLQRASAEAAAMCHTYTGTEHILLGLLAEEDGCAAHLFASRGVDIAKTRQTILRELASTSGPPSR